MQLVRELGSQHNPDSSDGVHGCLSWGARHAQEECDVTAGNRTKLEMARFSLGVRKKCVPSLHSSVSGVWDEAPLNVQTNCTRPWGRKRAGIIFQ